MQSQTAAIFAGGVILWFALSFVTRTWIRQWIAAVVAGVALAAFQYGRMVDVAAQQGLEPMSGFRFGLFAIAGMMILASAGMGLYLLMKQIRRQG